MSPSAYVTASITISPAPQHVPHAVNDGVGLGTAALAIVAALLLGRVWQFFRDVNRGIGPKNREH